MSTEVAEEDDMDEEHWWISRVDEGSSLEFVLVDGLHDGDDDDDELRRSWDPPTRLLPAWRGGGDLGDFLGRWYVAECLRNAWDRLGEDECALPLTPAPFALLRVFFLARADCKDSRERAPENPPLWIPSSEFNLDFKLDSHVEIVGTGGAVRRGTRGDSSSVVPSPNMAAYFSSSMLHLNGNAGRDILSSSFKTTMGVSRLPRGNAFVLLPLPPPSRDSPWGGLEGRGRLVESSVDASPIKSLRSRVALTGLDAGISFFFLDFFFALF